MNYSVGQVLYVILDKQTAVYPMIVVEEIIKRTMNKGQIVSDYDYVLHAGADNPKVWSLSAIKGEIFSSAEDVRKSLVERAVSSINKHVDSAVAKAAEWYGETLPPQREELRSTEEDDAAYIDLGGGVKGKIRMNNSVI